MAIESLQSYRKVPAWFWLPALLLVAIRLLHLDMMLDNPHMWRQSDTEYYIWDFYVNGVDFLHPAVCWMGTQKTLILEFPLHEAVAAWVYQLLGPSLIWARLVSLAFFLGSASYFYKIIRQLFQAQLAAMATLIFLMLPLGLYYSRAVHIDFSAVFFAHGMFYYFLKAIDEGDYRWMGLSMGFASLALVIKAPYAFYFALPGLLYVYQTRKWRFFLRQLVWTAMPLLLFAAWTWHVNRVNGAAPDWDFLPDYHKMNNRWGWYFGRMQDRMYIAPYQLVWGRLKFEVLAVWGVGLAVLGGIIAFFDPKKRILLAWGLGTLVYFMIFFGLNVKHNYYQIPFLAPAAVLIALPFYQLHQLVAGRHRPIAALLVIVTMTLFAVNALRLATMSNLSPDELTYFKDYYQEDPLPQMAGTTIGENTPQDAVVICTYGGLDVRCPLILNAGHRLGWSVPNNFISVEIIQRLRQEKATHFAILQKEPLAADLEQYLLPYPVDTFFITREQVPLRIFDLR